MTTVNVPLQARAGKNIGIEPGPGPFVQHAGGEETPVNPVVGSMTPILACPDGVRRTPLFRGAAAEGSGVIFNNTALDFSYRLFFRDKLGNEVPVGPLQTVGAAASDSLLGYDDLEETAFCLTPGESIVLRPQTAPPSP
jgi:hypothetical protein